MSGLREWQDYDRRKRDVYHLAFRLRELGKTDEEIMRMMSKAYEKSRGLLNEVEWYLKNCERENWTVLPLYEGAFWWDKQTRGKTPDFIVAGEYPDVQGRFGIFFVEIKSNRRVLDNAIKNGSIARMQKTIMSFVICSEDDEIPLYIYLKDDSKWIFERF